MFNMDTMHIFSDVLLDLIFVNLNEEDLYETFHVCKTWFWASIRRIKKIKLTKDYNRIKLMVDFYNAHCSNSDDKIDWRDVFKHLVLDKLVIDIDHHITYYLLKNGLNTKKLVIHENYNDKGYMTFSSLNNVTRLQFFELHPGKAWQPFVAQVFESIVSEPSLNLEHHIRMFRLQWNTQKPGLQSITKLRVYRLSIDVIRILVERCNNLKNLCCIGGTLTTKWRHIFKPNINRINLFEVKLDRNVAQTVDAFNDMGRQLLPFLCQNFQAVEHFKFNGIIDTCATMSYEALPFKREESFKCYRSNLRDGMVNLISPIFECRKIHLIGYHCFLGFEENFSSKIKAKCVKFEIDEDGLPEQISPEKLFLEPDKVEHFSMIFQFSEELGYQPFLENSFQAFTSLNSVTLHCVNTVTIKSILDQCPSIEKLKLNSLKAMTIGNLPDGSRYENVWDLILEFCIDEPIDKVFQIFPSLLRFRQWFEKNDDDDVVKTERTEWLSKHLMANGKEYGFVFKDKQKIYYTHDDYLETELFNVQILLKYSIACKCYLKGFKLIQRFPEQELFYKD